MSVTFSGGITFTGGGFSFTGGPEAAGWFAGGVSPGAGYVSNLQRITFANDTATASISGSISGSSSSSCCSTSRIIVYW